MSQVRIRQFLIAAAQTVGITIRQSLLLRAHRLIE
jgi:hypothetical protein